MPCEGLCELWSIDMFLCAMICLLWLFGLDFDLVILGYFAHELGVVTLELLSCLIIVNSFTFMP